MSHGAMDRHRLTSNLGPSPSPAQRNNSEPLQVENMYVTREQFSILHAQVQILAGTKHTCVLQREFTLLKTQVEALTEAFWCLIRATHKIANGPLTPEQSALQICLRGIFSKYPSQLWADLPQGVTSPANAATTPLPSSQTMPKESTGSKCIPEAQLKRCSVLLEDFTKTQKLHKQTETDGEGRSEDVSLESMAFVKLKDEAIDEEEETWDFPQLDSIMETDMETDHVDWLPIANVSEHTPLNNTEIPDRLSESLFEASTKTPGTCNNFTEPIGSDAESTDDETLYETSTDSCCSDIAPCGRIQCHSDKGMGSRQTASTRVCKRLKTLEAQGVVVGQVRKQSGGKVTANKRQYCFYCHKPSVKMARHLVNAHPKETEVAKLLVHPKGSKERSVLLSELRNKGNYKHNITVLKIGDGELVLKRKPTSKFAVGDYLPCPHCLAFHVKKVLWKHVRKCQMNPDVSNAESLDDVDNESTSKKGKNRVMAASSRLVPLPNDSVGCREILSRMNKDKIYQYVHNDALIQKFGDWMYTKHGSDKSKHMYIVQKMRELARFVCCLQELDGSILQLHDVLQPTRFHLAVEGARKVGAFDPHTNKYMKPSVALNVGCSLKKVAEIVIGESLMNNDIKGQREATEFVEFLNSSWFSLVSSHALRSMYKKKWDKVGWVPLAEDVLTLQKYLQEVQEKAKQDVVVNFSPSSWETLCEAVLTEVLLFNRCREGAATEMPLSLYTRGSTMPEEPSANDKLSELEQELLHKLIRIDVQGKSCRKIAVLLTKRMVSLIDLLIETRDKAGISVDNLYVFARLSGLTHFDLSECLEKAMRESGVKSPECIASINFRKHVATLSQIVNLKDELDEVAKFLGQDCGELKECGRPENTFKLAEIAKMLIAKEKEITPCANGDQSMDSLEAPCASNQLSSLQDGPSSYDARPTPCPKTEILDGQKRKRRKRLWSEVEQNAVKTTLHKFISQERLPGKEACEDCLKTNPESLRRRTWTDVKFYVKNLIHAKRR